jgi:hypothetical protein
MATSSILAILQDLAYSAHSAWGMAALSLPDALSKSSSLSILLCSGLCKGF